MWFHHFLHLLCRAWGAMTSATSTNTLGFVLWTLLLAVVGWAAQVAASWANLGKTGDPTPLRTALAKSLLAVLFSAGGILVLVLIVWSIFAVVVVYRDHQSFIADNNALRIRVSELTTKPSACWLHNIGMKPPSDAPPGTRSGNHIVFFCDSDYEAPLTIRWDFTSPPTRMGVPGFPDCWGHTS